MWFEGILVYWLCFKQQLQPPFGFTTFLESNFKFREHIRFTLSVIGFTNIGINATGTFATLEKSFGRCFYVLTKQFDISCKLFCIDQQVIFCHINTPFKRIIPHFREQINGLPLYIINGSHCISPTRSVVSHQVAGGYTLKRDEIQPVGLMICTTLRAVMIYQACGLDKKRTNFW